MYAFALRRERVEGRGSNLSLLKEANGEREKRSAGCSAPFTAEPGYRMCEMCEMCEMRSERPVQGPRTREKGEKATNTTAGHSRRRRKRDERNAGLNRLFLSRQGRVSKF